MQAIRQVEVGTVVGEVCRKHGVIEATFYRWKMTCAGLDVRELGDGNRSLKQLVADLMLEKTILRDAHEKQW